MRIPEPERPATNPPLVQPGGGSIPIARGLPRAATVGGSALAGLVLGLALLALLALRLPTTGRAGTPETPSPGDRVAALDPAVVAATNAAIRVALQPTATPTLVPTATATATATPRPTPTPTATIGPTATLNVAATQTRSAEVVALQTAAAPTPTATPAPPTPTTAPPPPVPVEAPPTATPTPVPAPPPVRPAAAPSGTLLYASNKEGRWALYQLRPDGSGERRLTDAGADDYNGAWSPDGRSIAFVSERDGNPEIYAMNADGTGARRLTNNAAKDVAPVWSPGGDQIVFVSFRDQPTRSEGALYLMNRDGGDLKRLVNYPALSPTWSSQGALVFARPPGGNGTPLSLFTTTLNAQGVQQITPAGGADDDAPCFSPDGTQIAFSAGPQGSNRQIVVTNADGTGRRALTALGSDTSNPVWSPDGAWIAYASNRSGSFKIYVMRADGSDDQPITGGATKLWYLSWKP